MNFYKVKSKKIVGTSYKEIHRNALRFYAKVVSQTKRRSYVRSAYFNKDKVFLDLFWDHLYKKENHRDKKRRLKFLSCAIELIKNSTLTPASMKNPNKPSETLHRFLGTTPDHEKFTVQIKESSKSKQKYFISVFPSD